MVIFLSGCLPSTNEGTKQEVQDPIVIFLVRHAEKAVDSMEKDSHLTEEGYLRAAELARTLAVAEIEYVHSSNYIRTRNTAAPVADMFGLEMDDFIPGVIDVVTAGDFMDMTEGSQIVFI